MKHDPKKKTHAGADEGRQSVGALLRASRLRCGEEIEDVADMLRIKVRHLESIEDGRFDELPGSAYAVGFVRAYADHLGLDSEEVVRRFKEAKGTTTRPTKVDLSFPEPMTEGGVPKGAVIFLGAVVAVLIYGGWYLSSVDNPFYKRWIEPIPDRLASMVGPMTSSEPASDPVAPADQVFQTAPEAPEPPSEVIAPAAKEPLAETAAPDPEVSAGLAEGITPTTEEPTGQAPDDATTSASGDELSTVPWSISAPISEPVADVEANVDETATAPITDDVGQAELPASAPGDVPPLETSAEDATGDGAAADIEPAAEETATAAPVPVVETPDGSAEGLMSASETLVETATAPEQGDTPLEAAAVPEVTADSAADVVVTRVKLTILSDSWVKIYDLDSGDRFIEKLLSTGEELYVPDRAGLVLDSGNAGGLKIAVDGETIPAIGESGEVVRAVPLTADALKAR